MKSIFRKKRKKFWKTLIQFSILSFIGVVILGLAVFIYYAKDLPRPEKFTERPFSEPTRIYDRTGTVVLYTIYGEEKRDLVSIEEIPDYLIQALVSTEDEHFYKHIGVDLRGIARSIIANIKTRAPSQGGSTISQQLIRSTFLSGEKKLSRKIREVILTIELERRYSKDEIITFYLNQIPFGQNAYGVEAAAQTFFNKSVSEVSLPEAAILVSLIRSPGTLSPYGPNREALMIRKDYVIDRMVSAGYLNREDADEYKEIEIVFSPITKLLKAPHFTLDIVSYLNQKYGEEYLRTKGLRVITTLDWDLQQRAEEIIKEKAINNRYYSAYNSSLIALKPSSGEVLALVGSVDYFADPYPQGCTSGKNCFFDPYPNIANRLRQPGSTFKPFVYADAFKKGYTPDTIVVDEPIQIGSYAPQNYDGLFRGPVTLRSALAQSLNVPSIKVLSQLSNIKDSLATAKDLGITTLNQQPSYYGLSLVLGGGEVTLSEMASAYGTFANEGYYVPSSYIIKIIDSKGKVIESHNPSPKRVLSSNIARTITNILSDNDARAPMFGYNSALYIPGVAIKTGTTQEFKDGWAVGYNKDLVVGVWTGNNNNKSMVNAPGVTVAAPAWKEFFEYFLSLNRHNDIEEVVPS